MTGNQILPSSFRKSSAEEQEREETYWEPGESDLPDQREETVATAVPASAIRKISPTMLASSSQCLLRGLWKAMREKGIGPSPFTRTSMDDGREYEKRLVKDNGPDIWVQAINRALALDLHEDIPIRKCPDLLIGKGETSEAFVARVGDTLAAALPESKSSPFYFHEPRLAAIENGSLLQGQPDLLIWTGEEWILADIKCSEEARRTHGIQISAYARMLRAMRPDASIHPSGVVIHCANGYRYTDSSSPTDKSTALAHTQATPFPLASLEPVVADFIDFLSDPTGASLDRALSEAIFSSACNECEYRHRCYPRFLDTQHVSLLPIMKAELESILAAGITSIQGIIEAIDVPGSEGHQTLLELKDDSPVQLGFLRQKAAHVLKRGLYSSWRANEASLESPLFFVSVGDQSHFEPALTADSKPTCLVVYSEGERRRALGKMLAIKKDWNISVHVLSKEVQQTVHGPLPSLTLLPLAAILNEKRINSYQHFQKLYPLNPTDDGKYLEDGMKESPTTEKRLIELKTVWNFLLTSAIPFTLDPATEPA